MGESVRTVSVAFGYMAVKISRKDAERLITLLAADQGFHAPQPPVARYWCRKSPDGAPHPYIIGWTGPVAVKQPHAPTILTHESSARGAIVI